MDDSDNDSMPKRVHIEVRQETRTGTCPEHGDYASNGFGLGAGKTMHWSRCPKCAQEAQAAEKREQMARESSERQKRLEQGLDQAGIPLRFRERSFANYRADNAGQKRALAIAEEYAGNFATHRRSGAGLIFSGRKGNGKTHLANAIAQAIMSRYTVMYLNASDMIRMVRDTWKPGAGKTESQVHALLGSVDLLIIDEVGVQYGTDAERNTIFDIIDRRYRELAPTIIISNEDKKELEATLGERSFDRLREGGRWVPFDWASAR